MVGEVAGLTGLIAKVISGDSTWPHRTRWGLSVFIHELLYWEARQIHFRPWLYGKYIGKIGGHQLNRIFNVFLLNWVLLFPSYVVIGRFRNPVQAQVAKMAFC